METTFGNLLSTVKISFSEEKEAYFLLAIIKECNSLIYQMFCLEHFYYSLVIKIGMPCSWPTVPPNCQCRGWAEVRNRRTVACIKQSNISTDRQDLQSDLIFPMRENPRSQQAVDRGNIKRISTNIRMLQNCQSW